MKFLNQQEAINIDNSLFNDYKFSVDQLMELAGQSCAVGIVECYPVHEKDIDDVKKKSVLVCCGPGNNGGDGLVCARHLKIFGYLPTLYYPKRTDKPLYKNLLIQCEMNDIPIIDKITDITDSSAYRLIVDAIFGFSFKPPVRSEFVPVLDFLQRTQIPVCSIDIPSGWDVEKGPPKEGGINPQMLISLTAPKLCAKYFNGKFHFLGGRFVPKKLEEQFGLNLLEYSGQSLVTPISIKTQ